LSFGLWTSIHRATLKSIAARHYSFEVLNNRSHYIYHRDTDQATDEKSYFKKNGKRFFANTAHQTVSNPNLLREENENISLFDKGVTQIHPAQRSNSSKVRLDEQANPIKPEIGYGICIDSGTCNL